LSCLLRAEILFIARWRPLNGVEKEVHVSIRKCSSGGFLIGDDHFGSVFEWAAALVGCNPISPVRIRYPELASSALERGEFRDDMIQQQFASRSGDSSPTSSSARDTDDESFSQGPDSLDSLDFGQTGRFVSMGQSPLGSDDESYSMDFDSIEQFLQINGNN
jgi:hypothetical protein